MSQTMARALEGHRDGIDELVRKVRRRAWRSLPPRTRYEIREFAGTDSTSPATTTVAWIADTHMVDTPGWEPRRPGFDAVTGTFIHERAITPDVVCLGSGLELVRMAGVLVCVCCGGGTLGPDPGCSHKPPPPNEDVEP